MSDTWNYTPQPEEEKNTTQEPREQDAAPAQPAEPPVTPEPPASEPTPPVSSWSSDGTYRYVPPRATQPTPPSQPTPPPYQPPYRPTNQPPTNGYTGWTPPAQPPRKNKGWVVAIAILAALALLVCVVMGVHIAMREMGGSESGTPESSAVTGDTSADNEGSAGLGENAPSLGITNWDNEDGGLSDKEIIKRNYASTVLLTSYVQATNFYFGESALTEAGAATGIVMTEDGYIITNWHCVINESTGKPYDRIDVTVYGDDKTYENATVIGADESTDLAVIHIDATGLTPAQFGDSAELEVGDRVVALGNAAGLGWSASRGIVSALARDVYEDTGYAVQCLQIDASINPGNSGGPLLNNQGLVIGINSAKISATDYEGIGFTIPINEAKAIIDSLLKHGYVKGRVALGITGQTISSGMYEGFMIVTIEEGSSFAGTSAQVGDLIVAVDGEAVTDYGSLRSILSKHAVGDTVELKLLRSDYRTGKVTAFMVKVVLQEQKNTVK